MHVRVNSVLYRVSFSHVNDFLLWRVPGEKNDVDISTAITYCTIRQIRDEKDRNGIDIAQSYAVCNPLADNFCKSVGRRMSLTRALDEAHFTKEARKAFWDQYFTEHKDRRRNRVSK